MAGVGSIGTGDLFSGGGSSATSGTGGSNKTGGLGAAIDLSGATIQGHTINDGLDAKETANLFNSIINNVATEAESKISNAFNTTKADLSNAINDTKQSVSKSITNFWSNLQNSNGFKIAFILIGALIAWHFLKKK